MKINEKAGISIVLLGVLIALCSLTFSEWLPPLGFWINLMGNGQGYKGAWIDLPGDNYYIYTRHILLACILLASYGLMIYLDIIKTPEKIRSLFDESPPRH